MIRPATPEDAQAIAELQVLTWRAAYRGILPGQLLDDLSVAARRETWAALLAGDSKDSVTVLWEDPDGGELGGFCSFALPSRDEDATERTAEITAIYVDPVRWGNGIGKELLSKGVGELPAGTFDEATLWVFMPNAQARAFFARSGFKLDGAKKVHEPSKVMMMRSRGLLTG